MAYEIPDAKCIDQRKNWEEIISILVKAPFFDMPEWIPWGQVHDISPVWHKGDEGTLIVTDWLAEKRGWL